MWVGGSASRLYANLPAPGARRPAPAAHRTPCLCANPREASVEATEASVEATEACVACTQCTQCVQCIHTVHSVYSVDTLYSVYTRYTVLIQHKLCCMHNVDSINCAVCTMEIVQRSKIRRPEGAESACWSVIWSDIRSESIPRPSRSLWTGSRALLGPLGPPWGPMGPHGAPWGPMGPRCAAGLARSALYSCLETCLVDPQSSLWSWPHCKGAPGKASAAPTAQIGYCTP